MTKRRSQVEEKVNRWRRLTVEKRCGMGGERGGWSGEKQVVCGVGKGDGGWREVEDGSSGLKDFVVGERDW